MLRISWMSASERRWRMAKKACSRLCGLLLPTPDLPLVTFEARSRELQKVFLIGFGQLGVDGEKLVDEDGSLIGSGGRQEAEPAEYDLGVLAESDGDGHAGIPADGLDARAAFADDALGDVGLLGEAVVSEVALAKTIVEPVEEFRRRGFGHKFSTHDYRTRAFVCWHKTFPIDKSNCL